ncbi:threonine ammonia-lyase [Opitutus terrae]|uniref:Pyridoxal-5'-phosphate-dependent protein beta subunit n=1 Tax=Opitutus terrae (strain DSM 11246 / JCM 15787 / PB90-1) TaxID=452637 RepID=B1ZNK1_OPITP|nr:threonine/serine dehydratase [Opitutus terrae]ACB74435.1 Pyridoxal-5'-phosphate-dependent protein beta subunit [Opitutus terrae PB90-1]
MKKPSLTLDDVEAARARLAGCVRRTPCHLAPAIMEQTGMRVWLKRDDLQHTGSFKERGARHALLCLSAAERARGVVAASAGNHALGLAFHGATLGVKVIVVMPTVAPAVKIARCRGLGAEVVLHGRTFDDAQAFARVFAQRCGATYVHPFDDLRVIAGQGTLALEVLEQAPQLDTIVVPVGGGGLLAGVATAVKALRPDVRVIAVEPENAACFLAACVRERVAPAAVLPTLADGLAVAQVGALTYQLAASRVDDVVTVNEDELAAAIRLLARRAGVVAEGAGAAAVAAVLAGKVTGAALVLPITGRNVDARRHEQIVMAGEDEPAIAEPRAA